MKQRVIMVLVLLGTGVAQAANVWDGAGADNNWNTAANWDDNLVPSFPVGLNFGGTTRLTPNNDLSSLTVNGITFDSGAGAFVIGGNAITLGGDIVNNSANTQTIDLDMALGATRTIDMASAKKVILKGDLSGAGGLIVNSGGALTELLLYGNNSFSGGVTVNRGAVKTYSDTAFGTGDVTFDGGRWNGGSSVTLANNINFAANTYGNSLSATTEFAGQISGAGDFRINGFGSGTVKLSGDNSGWSGNWEFQGGNKLQLNHVNALGSGTTITFDNSTKAGNSRGTLETLVEMTGDNALTQDISLGSGVYSDNTATIRTTANLEQTGVISGNATTRLIKDGSGRLYLNGANTYSGGTTLSAGVVVTGNDAAFGTGDVMFDGSQWNSSASVVIANDIEFASGMTGNSLSHVTEFTGQFSGAGDVSVNGFESGVVKLSGDNSAWSGNWRFNGRNKLQLNHVNALGTGTTITFSTPGTAGILRGNLESLVDLTGANALTQDIYLGNASGLDDNKAKITTTEDMELTGVVSGAADAVLLKNGDGTLTFSQANTYAGATIVEAGKLVVNDSLASSLITVNSGGILGGSGSVQAVTLESGAFLAVGNSPGTMTFGGNLFLSDGSINTMEIIDGAFDILMGDGANTLTMDGETIFDFSDYAGGVEDGFSVALSDLFVNWGSIEGDGTYSATGLAEGQSIVVDFGEDSLTVIPEPATLTLVVALGVGILWVRRAFL